MYKWAQHTGRTLAMLEHEACEAHEAHEALLKALYDEEMDTYGGEAERHAMDNGQC